jgi:hypothetical protein
MRMTMRMVTTDTADNAAAAQSRRRRAARPLGEGRADVRGRGRGGDEQARRSQRWRGRGGGAEEVEGGDGGGEGVVEGATVVSAECKGGFALEGERESSVAPNRQQGRRKAGQSQEKVVTLLMDPNDTHRERQTLINTHTIHTPR